MENNTAVTMAANVNFHFISHVSEYQRAAVTYRFRTGENVGQQSPFSVMVMALFFCNYLFFFSGQFVAPLSASFRSHGNTERVAFQISPLANERRAPRRRHVRPPYFQNKTTLTVALVASALPERHKITITSRK